MGQKCTFYPDCHAKKCEITHKLVSALFEKKIPKVPNPKQKEIILAII